MKAARECCLLKWKNEDHPLRRVCLGLLLPWHSVRVNGLYGLQADGGGGESDESDVDCCYAAT